MSFFKRIAKMLMPPKVDISLKLNEYVYFLGDNIEGELSISSSEDFEAEEIRVELECVESKRVIEYVYDPSLKRRVRTERWEKEKLYSDHIPLTGKLYISKGFREKYLFSVKIPTMSSPTYRGINREVKWTIKGVVAVKFRRDATSGAIEIVVRKPLAAPVIEMVEEMVMMEEVAMAPCKYCETLFPVTKKFCPRCGAPRTG